MVQGRASSVRLCGFVLVFVRVCAVKPCVYWVQSVCLDSVGVFVNFGCWFFRLAVCDVLCFAWLLVLRRVCVCNGCRGCVVVRVVLV